MCIYSDDEPTNAPDKQAQAINEYFTLNVNVAKELINILLLESPAQIVVHLEPLKHAVDAIQAKNAL